MGAEIVWRDGPHGILRFGPEFTSSATRDRFAGFAYIEPRGETCAIGPLAGRMTLRCHDEILEACALSFGRAEVERHGEMWVYDLTTRPFRRVRLKDGQVRQAVVRL